MWNLLPPCHSQTAGTTELRSTNTKSTTISFPPLIIFPLSPSLISLPSLLLWIASPLSDWPLFLWRSQRILLFNSQNGTSHSRTVQIVSSSSLLSGRAAASGPRPCSVGSSGDWISWWNWGGAGHDTDHSVLYHTEISYLWYARSDSIEIQTSLIWLTCFSFFFWFICLQPLRLEIKVR